MSYKDKIDTIPFEERAVRAYLDRVIVHWRERREFAKEEETKLQAIYYIDAYQSMRISLFGELLR